MENYSLSDIASATGGEGFGGSSAWVLIILFALIFGWGGNGFGGNAANALSQADLQRAVDLNSIQQGQAGIAADIQRTTYETIASTKDAAYNNLGEIRDVQSAVAVGNANIINNLAMMQNTMQNCCCETRYNLLSPQIKVDFEPFLKHTDTLRNEIDVEEKKEAVKSCTEKWVAWERETKEVYEKAYTTLVEYKEIASAYKIIMLINDVSEEYDRANDLCLALKNTDYDMGFLMEVEDA